MMRMLSARTLTGRGLVAFVVGWSLAACAPSDGRDGSPPSPSTSATLSPASTTSPSVSSSLADSPSSCDDAFHDAAETLAGSPLGPADVAPFSLLVPLSTCVWQAEGVDVVVSARSFAASQWAEALPEVIRTVLRSGVHGADRAALESALEKIDGGNLDDAAACELFATLEVVETGAPRGLTRVIDYVPSRTKADQVHLEECRDGRYRSIQLVAPDLRAGRDLERRMVRALDVLPD
jgi:hypothetical protein